MPFAAAATHGVQQVFASNSLRKANGIMKRKASW